MNRRSTYRAPGQPGRRPVRGRRRGGRALLGAATALILGVVLTGGLTLFGSEQSDAATRTQVTRCARHIASPASMRARIAVCRSRLLARMAHQQQLRIGAWPSWTALPTGTPRGSTGSLPGSASTAPASIGLPVTAAPSTPASSSSAPTGGLPVTSTPVTTAPISTAPVSSAPITSAPITSAPSVTTPPDTATPTASASATPTDPSATAGSSVFTAAFATRPSSGAVVCNGQSNVTISGLTFTGIGNDQPAITVKNCSNVTITQNDFVDDAEPIYVVNSTNVHITYNRYRDITGPHQRNGSHRGNFTQWENSTGGSISANVGIGGDTEDIISIYKSGGASSASPLVIEGNHFEGTNWSSSSGSGMMLGDGGGSHIVVRNNTLVNPGQVGIGVSGGSDIHVTDNTILGQARTSSNVGIYVWGQGTSCSAIEVADNTVDWRKASGTVSGGWDGGTCGSITGWSSNAFSASLSYDSLAVDL